MDFSKNTPQGKNNDARKPEESIKIIPSVNF